MPSQEVSGTLHLRYKRPVDGIGPRERDGNLGESVSASSAFSSPGLDLAASDQSGASGVRIDSGSAQCSETL
jgi:hypothetical protein